MRPYSAFCLHERGMHDPAKRAVHRIEASLHFDSCSCQLRVAELITWKLQSKRDGRIVHTSARQARSRCALTACPPSFLSAGRFRNLL